MAKWLVDALEKMDDKAKVVLERPQFPKSPLMTTNGGPETAFSSYHSNNGHGHDVTDGLGTDIGSDGPSDAGQLQDAPSSSLNESHCIAADDRLSLQKLMISEQQKADQLFDMEQQYSRVRKEAELARDELERCRAALKSKDERNLELQQEYQAYKVRATKMMQDKERQVKALDADRNPVPATPTQNSEQVAELISDRDAALHKVVEAQGVAEQLRNEINVLVEQISEMQKEITAKEQKLFSLHSDHRAVVAELTQNNAQLQQYYDAELKSAAVATRKLTDASEDKDLIILKLEKKIELLRESDKEKDLEAQLKAMAVQMMSKQSSIEMLTKEKENVALQLKSAMIKLKESKSSYAVMDPADDVEANHSVGDNMMWNSLARKGTSWARLARTSSAIDRLGLGVGRILRRSVALRFIFLLYIMTLHAWVLFVIAFSSIPAEKSELLKVPD